jgi:hypothetical protein
VWQREIKIENFSLPQISPGSQPLYLLNHSVTGWYGPELYWCYNVSMDCLYRTVSSTVQQFQDTKCREGNSTSPLGLLYTVWTNTTWTLAYGQSFWLNCSVHRASHMRYSLSHQIGQTNGKDVSRTFSRGSPDSGVQLTASDCHNLGLTIWDRKDIGVEDAQSTFSAKISCA